MAVLRDTAVAMLTLALVSCGGARTPVEKTQTGPLRIDQVEAIIDRVIRVRQLKPSRPIQVERLDDKAMIAKLRGGSSTSSSDGAGAALVAFNLHDDKSRLDPSKIVEDLVLGLYDKRSRKIYYRGAARNTEKQLLKQRLVIAHEVHHALQFQSFGEPKKPEQLDGTLALDALYEGDAQVTMAAFAGSEYGVPLNRTLRSIFDIHDRVKSEEIAHDTYSSHSVAVTKRLLLFPYEDGMRFVADVYRAGGLELVNRMYEQPPVSTEQVLHPNKYLEGELPTPVNSPTAPGGYRVVDHDRLGELGMSQVLGPCIGETKAVETARGWAGDHYAVVVDDKHVALLWSTVWDDEARAQNFAQLVDGRKNCWSGITSQRWKVREHLAVKHDGRRVAIVTGIDPSAAETITAQLLTLVGETPAPQEITSKRVPETEPIPKASRGTLRDDRYASEWLGVTATMPSGMHATVSEEAEVAIRREGESYAALFTSDRVHTDGYNEATFDTLQAEAMEGAGVRGLQLDVLSSHIATTSLGKGVARLWGARGTKFRMRVLLVPVCYGTGSYVFVQAYADDEAQKILDGWIDSFRWTSLDPPTICKMLNPR